MDINKGLLDNYFSIIMETHCISSLEQSRITGEDHRDVRMTKLGWITAHNF